MEHAADGIRINAVTPGMIDTPLNRNPTPEMYASFEAATPVGRLESPREVAAAAYIYLASPLADFVTGAALAVDGGWAAH